MAPMRWRGVLLAGAALMLASCGGGGGGGSSPAPITFLELVDPSPHAGDQFGRNVVILANGNIVVSDPFDSSVASQNGAVHLYDPRTQMRIGSFFGDTADDQLGAGAGITALANGNFVIASPGDDVAGILDAGSVMLVNGATGAQIGATIAGNAASDRVGTQVAALPNGNFVIVSPLDDVGGVSNAGSVMLVDGATGAPIGAALTGNTANDLLGLSGVTVLANGNFAVVSPNDDVAGIPDAGSVILVDGATGAQVGATIAGNATGDLLGSGGVTALVNGNFAIASPADDVGSVSNAGSVMLVNGTTGAQIGFAFAGDAANDQMGSGGVTALANGNFVIASPLDDVGSAVVDAGSVRLVNGTTGTLIGGILTGILAGDSLGSGGVTALANGNFVIASPLDDAGGVVDAGLVSLMNGATGAVIGAQAGNAPSDQLGSGGVTALANGNFVIASPFDDVGSVSDAGSVMLVDGASGARIGSILAGDAPGDELGFGSITGLANGNFVIASVLDEVGGVSIAGSVTLVSGTTGARIGVTLAGDAVGDKLGAGGVTALANSDFIVVSPDDDVGGVADAGSVIVVNGATGAQIGSTLAGTAAGDMNAVAVAGSPAGDFYVLGVGQFDNNGLANSGLVRLITL
jgi:Repeat of unknown function (DUF5650)